MELPQKLNNQFTMDHKPKVSSYKKIVQKSNATGDLAKNSKQPEQKPIINKPSRKTRNVEDTAAVGGQSRITN